MPTYVYACTNPDCGHQFEAVQAFTDDALTVCPVCGQRLRKVFGSVGVVFKGSGFYRNDSREKATSSAGKATGADGSTGKKSEAGSSESRSSDSGRAESGKATSDRSGSGATGSGKADSGTSSSSTSTAKPETKPGSSSSRNGSSSASSSAKS